MDLSEFVFGLNTEKYGPEKPLHLDIFHIVDMRLSATSN